MTVEHFIETKSKQLAFFIRGYWKSLVPHAELEHFFWETLEEWHQMSQHDESPYTHKERVFWHLLHQMHFWSGEKLMEDLYLRQEMSTCLAYLEDNAMYPIDCVGVRP